MKKNYTKLLSVLLGCLSLVGCSTIEHPNIPQDYEDTLASIEGGTVENVNFNTKDQYYNNFTDINQTALNNLLLTVAEKVTKGKITDRNDGTVLTLNSSVANDSTDGNIKTFYATTTDTKATLTFKNIGSELKKRGEESLAETIVGGSYNKNDRFDENKLIKEVETNQLTTLQTLNGAQAKTSLSYGDMKVLNSEMKFDEIFTTPGGTLKAGTADYSEYIQDALYPEIVRNKLTAQYIYNEKYGNIALNNMQKLNVLTITDRTDVTGAARKFINTYYSYYCENGAVDPAYAGKPIEEMEKLWNGIGAFNDEDEEAAIYCGTNSTIDPALTFYGWNDQYENYLTTVQKEWLVDNEIETLFDEIVGNYYKAKVENDLDQISDFSSSNSQEMQKGLISKIDALLKSSIRQEGIYTKSGLSSVDSSVTDRVFTQYTSEDQLMKDFTNGDLSSSNLKFYFPVVSESNISAPVFYSSGKYTFVQMEYNYNNSNLGTTKARNKDKGAEAVANAMDAAYEMIGDGNYGSDAVVYWLKNLAGKDKNFTVHNEDFYDYLESNYPDLLDDDK